jgi:hypothetical protein
LNNAPNPLDAAPNTGTRVLRADPTRSNRAIADQVGASGQACAHPLVTNRVSLLQDGRLMVVQLYDPLLPMLGKAKYVHGLPLAAQDVQQSNGVTAAHAPAKGIGDAYFLLFLEHPVVGMIIGGVLSVGFGLWLARGAKTGSAMVVFGLGFSVMALPFLVPSLVALCWAHI